MNEREIIKRAISKDMPDFDAAYFIRRQNNISGCSFMSRKFAVSMLLVLLVICGVGTVYAASGLLGVGKVTKANIAQLKKNGTTNSVEISEENSLELQELQDVEEMTWEKICVDTMKPFTLTYENGEYTIKDIYIEPGYGIMLQRADEMGFQLKEGEVLNCNVILDLSHMSKNITSVGVEFGYILNGKYQVVQDVMGSEFSFQLNAEEDGEYFPCVLNQSSANLVVGSGIIH